MFCENPIRREANRTEVCNIASVFLGSSLEDWRFPSCCEFGTEVTDTVCFGKRKKPYIKVRYFWVDSEFLTSLLDYFFMKLTTRGRFAVTSMIDLALYGQDAPVRLADIARREQISVAYLEQIFVHLRRAGLVTSARGPGGGYRLAKDPEEITAGAIVDALEASVDATQCHGTGKCRGGAQCLAHGLWSEMNEKMRSFLDSQTLASIRTRYANTHAGAREAVVVFKDRHSY